MAQRKRTIKILSEVEITGLADKGRGVGTAEDGRIVFVDDVAPGDIVDVRVTKKKKAFFQGRPVHFHKYSPDRVEPFCPHFWLCGGCKYQHISYEDQLKFKQQRVVDALTRLGKIEVGEIFPILGAEETTYYRNKLEFSFSSKRWLTYEEIANGTSSAEDVLGFHKAGAFDKCIDIQKCFLQPDPSNGLRNHMRELGHQLGYTFWDARANIGFLRNVIVRTTTTGQTMIIVAFGEDDLDKVNTYLDAIIDAFPKLTSVYYCINLKVNDYIMDLPMVLYKGESIIEEKLKDVRFHIGPKSFFQTNTRQAIRLYDVVKGFADLQGDELVYDLYTGLGSIALYMADSCNQVVGIEEIPEAIEDAKRNAGLNNIDNTIFYSGDVRKLLTDAFIQSHDKPDVIITDPPRAGMHPKVVQTLLDTAVKRIVYVSCNPATQARDLQVLSEKYTVLKVQAVDMFPHTHHIESVALLELR